MKQLVTTAIVLTRTDYGEADRIITLLTPDHGKLRLIAKGVRRVKSKLAGGIELFSISDITYIQGRGAVGTLISARLETHFGQIVKDIDRTMCGYELIKQLNKATEDEPESDYFVLLAQALNALNDFTIELDLIRLWFESQLLRLAGHEPNLRADIENNPLEAAKRYDFSYEDVAFRAHAEGRFDATTIKFLRLLFVATPPQALAQITDAAKLVQKTRQLVQLMTKQYIQ